MFFQAICELQLPNIMSKIIDFGVLKGEMEYIYKQGAIMLGFAVISVSLTVLVSFLASKIAAVFAMDLREKVFLKVTEFSLADVDEFGIASLITRSTNDVTQVQTVLAMILRMVVFAPIMAIGGTIMAIAKNPKMSPVIFVAILVLVAMFIVVLKIGIPKFKLVQNLTDKLNLRTRENIVGIRVIRAFNAQTQMQDKFLDVNSELTRTNLFVNRIMSFLHPGITLIQNITAILVVYYGCKYIGSGDLLVGDMIAFLQYSLQIIFSFSMISMVGIMLPKAMVSLNRISEVCDAKISIKDIEKVQTPDFEKYPYLEFKNVSFVYKGASNAVISNISFVAELGKTTAIIGSTGSGKSTIAKLIPRFYDVTGGEINIGGVNIRNMSQKYLRELLGYVPQKSILFSGTVEENINYTMQDVPIEYLKNVANISQSAEFIETMSESYNSMISEGGTNLSGGQKQRLSMARAIFKDPKIYIFDDSFSALDYRTDFNLRNALKEVTKDKMVIIISQRINTIIEADNIIVLDNGQIVGQGTHSDLIRNCKIYREIKQSQD